MKLKQPLQSLFLFVLSMLFTVSITAQEADKKVETTTTIQTDFSDRQAILKTIENFYIGDHTGSTEHKKKSMHTEGAYRYVDKNGAYGEFTFQVDSDDSDPNYKEELLSVEIYGKMAVAKLRLDQFRMETPEYKLMILHKIKEEWKITSIVWGFGVTQ